MPNILVIDSAECSCFLVRSILLGRGLRVSVSLDLENARAKLATGLFDAVFIDFGHEPEAEVELIREIDLAMPWVPVMAVCRRDAKRFLEGLPLFLAVDKPIRVLRVAEASLRAMRHVEQAMAASKVPLRSLDIPARVKAGQREVRCRAADGSFRGLRLVHDPSDFKWIQAFHEFFGEDTRDRLEVVLEPKEQDELILPASVAFAERTPDRKVREVGLAFNSLEPDARAGLERLFQGGRTAARGGGDIA